MTLVDLDRYDIESSDVVAHYRQQLTEKGVALLPGFVRAAAIADIAAEANRLAPDAYLCDDEHNVYLDKDIERPRMRTVVASIAYDLLPANSPLRELYTWDPLVEFVRGVIGAPELHRLADPLGACSINVFRPGDFHAWHFDESEFTTTLMLQEADDGGWFENDESSACRSPLVPCRSSAVATRSTA
jgi:alkylated DNA repair dioxygenase AlkB